MSTTSPAGDGPPGAIARSPDPKKLRDGLARRSGLRRRLFIRLRQPANRPGFFGDPPEELPFHFNKGIDELVKQLKGARDVNEKTAVLTLAEAQAVFDEPVARIDSAERRATTLQGTVAISASLVVGGAGLLLDTSKVHGHGWRITLALTLAALLVCLIGCAVRALSATSRIFQFEQPGYERLHQRAGMSPTDASLHLAAELLRASSVADEIAGMKIGFLQRAAWWFRCALIFLALLAGVLCAYAIASGSEESPESGATMQRSATVIVAPTPGANTSSRPLPSTTTTHGGSSAASP